MFFHITLPFRKGLMLVWWVLIIIHGTVNANEIEDNIETLQTDISHSAEPTKKKFGKKSRIVPIPIPVSNPTIGTGLAAALVYMHPPKNDNAEAPTSTTSIAGIYTNTESWGVGALHDGYYRDDRIRLRIPIAHGDLNLKFYGIGNDALLKDDPVEYNAASNAAIPRILFRLPWNNWYLGAEYRLITIDTKFDQDISTPDELPGADEESQTAGLGILSVFDSRDSNFWPVKGNWLEVSGVKYGTSVGGDYDYFKLIAKWAQYFQVTNNLICVYRLDGQFVEGTAPFWDLSRIRLRGYAGGQLLDNVAATAQAEIRWQPHRKWTVIAFGGGGRIADDMADIGNAPTNWAGGGGFKYMLVEDQKLNIGIDLALAEGGDVAFYFQVGDWLAH